MTLGGVRRRHVEHDEEHENSERWLLTYADLITLLLALFMMLFAVSNIDKDKFKAFQASYADDLGKGVKAKEGPNENPSGKETGQEAKDPNAKPQAFEAVPVPSASASEKAKDLASKKDLAELQKKLKYDLKKQGLEKKVDVGIEDRGLVVFVTDGVLFDSGQAQLRPEGAQVLSRLALVFKPIGNPLRVEGHTDNRPISTYQFQSNWELSGARAGTVVRTMIAGGIKPTRVRGDMYADTRPRTTNGTEAGRAKNRRVEIIVETPEG